MLNITFASWATAPALKNLTETQGLNHHENPFGGGVGAGVKVTPVAFLIIKDGSVRMLPVAAPANTTADRLVEMVPDTLDKISAFIDSRTEKKAE